MPPTSSATSGHEAPIRALLVVPRYPPDRCGVGDYTRLLARHLAAQGIAVTVLCSRDPALDAHRPHDPGVQVLPLIADWGWGALAHLVAVARAGRYDLVHVQYQNEMYGRAASIAALPLALRAVPRVPAVVTVHDYGTPWPRRLRARLVAGPYGKAWFAVMLWTARQVVLTNEQDEHRFLRQRLRYPVPAARYTTIPIGSNLPALSPDSGTIPTDVIDAPTAGYFGFVNPAKGVDMLLDGIAAARQARPALQLVMICTLHDADPYQRSVAARIATDPMLREAVTVTGELPESEVSALLARCTLVALPFTDGVSLRRTTLLAALALGCAVISTVAKVPPAGLVAGRDLVLVAPGDGAALGTAILALLDDPAHRQALGAQARARMAAFAWPAIAARTAALYRTVMA